MKNFFLLLLGPMAIQHIVIKEYYISREKRNKRALAFFFLLLTALIMLRHESIGNDTKNYIHFFETFAGMNWEEVENGYLELGFSYFNKIVSLISKEPQFYIAVTAVMVNMLIYPTYKRLCVDPSLTIVLFCTMSTFVMMFSGIRQMMAIGIGFIAYEFTRNRKLIPFIFSICLAMTFHTSAFMLIFMYPLYHAKVTRKWLIAVVPAFVLIFVFNRPIFSVLTTIMAMFTQYDGSISLTGAVTMIFLFIVFTVFAFVIPDESRMDAESIGLRNFLLLSLIVQMFTPLHTLAMRMNYYYIIFIPLLLPKIIEYRSKRWNQVAIIGRHVMVLFFLIYFFVNADNSLNIFPYHFFWENI